MFSPLMLLKPTSTVSTLFDLSLSFLHERSITHLIFDVDDTLVPHNGEVINATVANHLKELSHHSIEVFLASNSRRNLDDIAGQIGARVIKSTWLSRKPLRNHYRKIVREVQADPKHIAMVGDRLLTDMLGGNLAGMHTILVPPIGGGSGFFARRKQ